MSKSLCWFWSNDCKVILRNDELEKSHKTISFLDYKISSNETAILEMHGIISNTNNPIIRLKQDN